MILFPALDLYEGQAVRLVKGDYHQKTVYSENPVGVALHFKDCGARHLHTVDLEGARSGNTPNFDLILQIKKESGLFVEVGGGIRDLDTVRNYLDAGIDRVILGTAAVKNAALVETAVKRYHQKIAVGIDLKDGFAAINGWMENSLWKAEEFLEQMRSVGVQTIICTDISRDGMMTGPNRRLYRTLSEAYPDIDLIASGGISDLEDIRKLKALGLHGAIIGKACYTNSIDLREAMEVAE